MVEASKVELLSTKITLSPADRSDLVQAIVQALSDIDFEYGCELQRLEASQTTPEIRWLMTESLKEHYRERRKPFVRRLAELHRQRVSPAGPGTLDVRGEGRQNRS